MSILPTSKPFPFPPGPLSTLLMPDEPLCDSGPAARCHCPDCEQDNAETLAQGYIDRVEDIPETMWMLLRGYAATTLNDDPFHPEALKAARWLTEKMAFLVFIQAMFEIDATPEVTAIWIKAMAAARAVPVTGKINEMEDIRGALVASLMVADQG